MNSIQIKYVKEHVEVYYRNVFLFSADTVEEAYRELRSQMVQLGG